MTAPKRKKPEWWLDTPPDQQGSRLKDLRLKDNLGRAIGKRSNNGAENRGLSEDTQIVRGPHELLKAMRVRAARDGRTVTETWRRAAERYLKG